MGLVFFVFGAMFGSAANALVDRLPRHESWMRGRSKCDKCGHRLGVWDLIPLLSYVWLGGKCRYCHKKISVRNFWVEVVMVAGFTLIFNYQFLTFSQFSLIKTLILCLILWVSVIIFVMDWETMLVSDWMVIIWAGLVLIYKLLVFNFQSIFNLQFSIGLLAAVGLIGGIWLVSRGKAMGFGDIEIAAVLGWWLGWPKVAVALWSAFVLGGIYGAYLLVTGKKRLKSKLAFGPWLVVGAWVGWFWGTWMIQLLYGRVLGV